MRSMLGRLAVFVFVLSCSAAAVHAADGSPPNILLILSDDHSAAHVGTYGNPDVKTPNLDKLATEGIRFDRAYVTCPQCVPSRASILTGRHPIDIGMTRFSAALPRDVVTFPEILRQQRGYFTGLAGRSYHLSGSMQNNPQIKPHLREQDFPNFDERFDYVKTAPGQDADARAATLRQFNEFLDKVPQGKPFFLQLNWSDPHRPLTDDDLPHKHDPAKLTLPPFYPDMPETRRDLAGYYDEIGRLDGNIGKVLKTLDERNLSENTVVIFMGDNGGSQLRGKGTLNEFGIRVPLIVRYPGVVKPGSVAKALVSGDDLAPTLLAAAGVEVPTNLTGVNLLPLLRDPAGAPAPRTQIVAERGPHASSPPRGSASFDLGRVIVTDRYKLIYNALWQLPYQPVDFKIDPIRKFKEEGKLSPELTAMYLADQRPIFELYDLQNDPHEMKNLAGAGGDARKVEQELKGRLAAWMIQHRDFIPLPLGGNRNRTEAEKISGKSAEE